MKVLTALLILGMFLTTIALADDVDDVKAAVQKYFTALNTGDAEAHIQARMPEHSAFARGGLLRRFHSLEEQTKVLQASVDSGEKSNYQLRHLEVRIFGNTAVVTGYVVGTVTNPDGITDPVSRQRTEVWVKQGGQWKQAHRHASPLRRPQ